MRASAAAAGLALALALAAGDARSQGMPDNSAVSLDPDDNPDPAYRATLEGHERLRLEEAVDGGRTFLPYFYGSAGPPAEPAPPPEPAAAQETLAPRPAVTTYEGLAAVGPVLPAGLVEALLERWNRAPAIVTLAYPAPRGEPGAGSGSRPPAAAGLAPGTALYGRILYGIRSDLPGPVVIEILEPPLAGALVTGSFERFGERLALRLTRLRHRGRTRDVDAWGVGLDCACFAVPGDVESHWFERVLLPAAAAFAERWLTASSAPRTTVSIDGDVVIAETAGDRALREGLAGSAGAVADVLLEHAPQRATVSLARDTEVAVVLLDRVEGIDVGDD